MFKDLIHPNGKKNICSKRLEEITKVINRVEYEKRRTSLCHNYKMKDRSMENMNIVLSGSLITLIHKNQ